MQPGGVPSAEPNSWHMIVHDGVLSGAVFDGERFQCMDFGRVALEDVVFLDCDLRGSDLSNCSLSHVLMYRCWVHGAQFPPGTFPIFIECEERLAAEPHAASPGDAPGTPTG